MATQSAANQVAPSLAEAVPAKHPSERSELICERFCRRHSEMDQLSNAWNRPYSASFYYATSKFLKIAASCWPGRVSGPRQWFCTTVRRLYWSQEAERDMPGARGSTASAEWMPRSSNLRVRSGQN